MKDKLPKIYTYYGKNIELLTREELLEALKHSISECHKLYEDKIQTAKIYSKLI